MPDLFEVLEGGESENLQPIRELRLGPEPAMVLLFARDVEEAYLHYEPDESARGYLVCPGKGCPYCDLGSAPGRVALLPIYNIESGTVEVLRIPTRAEPGSLGALLTPFTRDPEIANKVLLISRSGSRYRVEAKPLSENADRGVEAIRTFLEARKAGLSLKSAFLQPTADEMREIPRLRRKLDAIGGSAGPTSYSSPGM